MAIVAGPDAMTNGDTPAPPMGEAHVCNSPVALSAEPKPKNRTSINIFANFAFDLIPKFACEGAGRIAAKRRIDTLERMPSLLRLLTVIAVLCAVVYGGLYALAHFVEPKSREISVSVPPDKFFKEH